MKRDNSVRKLLGAVSRFFLFFLLVAFLITCCMMLFISTLQGTLAHRFTADELASAAKITMAIVILITLVFTLIDGIRRKYTVERPVKRITEATEKMIRGDFSVRIPVGTKFATPDSSCAIWLMQ